MNQLCENVLYSMWVSLGGAKITASLKCELDRRQVTSEDLTGEPPLNPYQNNFSSTLKRLSKLLNMKFERKALTQIEKICPTLFNFLCTLPMEDSHK